MARRPVRTLAQLAAALVVATVARRVIEDRRRERRPATPLPAWPDVPLDDDSPPSS